MLLLMPRCYNIIMLFLFSGPSCSKVNHFSDACLSVTDQYILMEICPQASVTNMSQPAKFETCIIYSVINIQI